MMIEIRLWLLWGMLIEMGYKGILCGYENVLGFNGLYKFMYLLKLSSIYRVFSYI